MKIRIARTLLAISCLLPGSYSQAQWSLNLITSLTTEDPMYKGLLQLKDAVETGSDGELTIRIFVGSQLGNDEDILEQARAGANVAVLVDGARLAIYTPELGILGAPYLSSGYDEIRKLVTSDLFNEWSDDLRQASGHQILSFNWWQGERHLLTSKPVTVPADLSGVRMRTPGAPVWLETIRGLGATPTPLAWSEVYSALQQDVIDAAEAQHPSSYNAHLYEVISHITKTGHINLITGLVCSAEWFDALPEHLQTLLLDSALQAGDYASTLNGELLDSIEAQFREAGVTITEIDVTPFRESTRGVYEKLGYTELRERVEAVLK